MKKRLNLEAVDTAVGVWERGHALWVALAVTKWSFFDGTWSKTLVAEFVLVPTNAKSLEFLVGNPAPELGLAQGSKAAAMSF